MRFTRLRLMGFKSFVEPSDVLIEPGLTGVVGPNGCGKSNLVEALRWVMGESSYKSMRGAGMDDVIFSGSSGRPARNTAEVTLFVDNSRRKAPAAFNDSDHLEVTRRIEREAGSVYKINGKDVRARDVQLLFADASTGAHSPALVRQGQIGELINAKPESRRRLLEEAAGISGLHSRRHEAELRLRGAETNLERLSDVIGQVEAQLQALKRQARHARRYKQVTAEIRKAQALLLHLKWTNARQAVSDAEQAQRAQAETVAARTRAVAATSKDQAVAAHAMPALREAEAKVAAALHRLRLARDNLDQELERARQRKAEVEARIGQSAADVERERAMAAEAAEIFAKLDAERAELAAVAERAAEIEAQARGELEQARGMLQDGDNELAALLDDMAQFRARKAQHERGAAEQAQRLQRFERQLADVEAEIVGLEAKRRQNADVARFSEAVAQAMAAVEVAEAAALDAERKHVAAREQEDALREPLIAAERDAQRLATEADTLGKLLNLDSGKLWPPLVDAVEVDKGYEAALGAALGDDLDAPADTAAPAHWEVIAATGDDPSLPAGVAPLAAHVRAPNALARRLAQIGVVDPAQGKALQRLLKTGQRLVSLRGDLWRWDGYSVAADAVTAAAQRLAQRNRLAELKHETRASAEKAAAARYALEAAQARSRNAAASEDQARRGWREAQVVLGQARDKLAEAERMLRDDTAKISALSEARARLKASLEEADAMRREALAALEEMTAESDREAALGALRASVGELRARFSEAQSKYDGLARDAAARAQRLKAIAQEHEGWTARRGNATRQAEVLRQRIAEASAELDALEGKPAEIEAMRRQLVVQLEAAEAERAKAADAVAKGEATLARFDKANREAEHALAEAREELARIESRLEAMRSRCAEIGAEIVDQVGAGPEHLLATAGFEPGAALPAADQTEARLEQLTRERERIGAVNLRAEEEAAETEARLASMLAEKDDLEKAIRRLRAGIGQLNKEGRERLVGAFDTVNEHFQRLFETLFSGGSAELRLTDSEDPLEAGLEILARPPGKKLQTLSLLSGGEQALTAMALIFAVFLTNPAPICVLDEVDAPLDDANIQRFCALIEEMTRVTDTRFIIITHNPITMSRMDRLFGVTMAERGVSQLVSVDLATAERFREAS